MAAQSELDLALNASELGTKEYWDNLYNREISNHEFDPEDEGTIWFDESNAEDKVLEHLNRLAEQGLIHRGNSPPHLSNGSSAESNGNDGQQASRFLDLGTGNGHMLFALLSSDPDDGNEENLLWLGEKTGVDYSASSISLAERILDQKFSQHRDTLHFHRWDLLSDQPGAWFGEGFDVVLDKGTFDAISLMPVGEGDGRSACEVYREKVVPLVKPGGFLFVTSCNWTRDELVRRLVIDDGEMSVFDEAKYPTFKFGGQTGQSVVTLIFRRRDLVKEKQ